MGKLRADLTGQNFGRLIVIKRVENDKSGNHRWLCRCDCGKEKVIRGSDLKNGHTKSCGCLKIKHGHTKNGKPDGIYKSWHDIIQRCTNPNCSNYKDYGGRGIMVCEEWLDFLNFEKDMIKGWKPGLTLERENNELGYDKENCEWITVQE